ncbi:MAG: hypothetical protein H6565_10230 [Lewinellaceae bacterium]|nr:hypothetical protein [Lewinellaceae bacterium]
MSFSITIGMRCRRNIPANHPLPSSVVWEQLAVNIDAKRCRKSAFRLKRVQRYISKGKMAKSGSFF